MTLNMHHFIQKMIKIKLNKKSINIYIISIDLINILRPSIHPQLVRDVMVILVIFWGMLLHINGIRSCKMHFWILAIGGNELKLTSLSLFAELWAPTQIRVEQAQCLCFSKNPFFLRF